MLNGHGDDIYNYEGIRMKIVWETITQDFKPLRDALSEILNALS